MKYAQAMIVLLLWVMIGSVCQAKHYKVYLLGGQSNASGRGDASQLTAPYDSPQTDVALFWHKTLVTVNGNLTQDQWVDLQPDSGQGKNSPSGHAVEFGPELAFGRAMADANPSANIAIIKYGHGGSNLHTQWSATGTMYATFISTVEAALSALRDAGHTYELIGMFWQQGEADTGATNADNYEANLTDLIARVRTDVFGGLNRPFVIGGLSSNQYPTITNLTTGAGKVRLAQETVALNGDTVGFANADDCEVYDSGNEIHFNYVGQLALGTGHAAEMIQLEALDLDADGLSVDQEATLGTDPANPDSDEDGQQDGVEFRAGTDPMNSNSLFKVTHIGVSSNEVTLSWPSKSGNSYRVECSTNLVEWADVEFDYPASTVDSNTVWSSADSGSEPSIKKILALYDAQAGSNGEFNTTAFDSVDTDSSTTAMRLVQGGSLTGGGAANFILANALFDTSASGSPGFNLADVNLASQSAAATAGDWFSFTLQPNGEMVDYDSLSFYADQHSNGAKVDISYTVGSTETFVLQNFAPVGGNVSVALVEVDFENFSSSEDVVWTFYLYGAPGTINGTRFDDITLYGAETAPPSSVLALFDAQTGINGDFNTTAFDSVDAENSTTATRLSQGGSLTGGGSDSFVLANAIFDTSSSGSPGFNLADTMTGSQSAAATAGDSFSFTLESGGATCIYEALSFYSNQHKTGATLDVSYTVGESETFILQDYIMPENNVAVELKTIDFDDFSSASNVVWTFYLFGAAAEINGNRFDDITLYGSSDADGTTEGPTSGFYRVNLQ